MKQDGSALRVLIVEDDALNPRLLRGILDERISVEVARADSINDARERIRNGSVDLVFTDETRLRGVLDAVFTYIGLFSLDGVVVDVNQAPLTAGGLRRDHVVGRRFVDLPWFAHDPAERARVADALRRAAAGETVHLETNVQRTVGGILHVDASFAPLRDDAGVVTHVVGTGVDVTARKTAEVALRRSQAQLAEAQRVAHVGSWEWDVTSNRVSWSDELYRIYGVDPTRFGATYEDFLSRVHPEDLERTKTVILQALRNVTAFIYDHRVIRPDGATRMLHTRGEVIPDGSGAPARLVGSCWDVTERWEATNRVEHTVSMLRATLEATADGILVGDRRNKISALNQQFLALWRLSDDVTPGCDLRRLAEDMGERMKDTRTFLARVTALLDQPDAESFDLLRFKDGRMVECHSRPQRVGADICGRVFSFRDVTQRELLVRRAEATQAELRSSADQLRALAARLDAIREEERRVIAREIHDQIGQGLTALKLDLAWLRGLLARGIPADDGQSEAARRLAAMDQLLDGTLDTARRVSATLRPAILDDLGLAAAIRWQAREFQSRTGVPCTTAIPEEGDQALGPEVALALFRIVQEALTNVARHAGAHHVAVKAIVDRVGDGQALVLTITDDGRGITPEELARPTSLGLLGMRERALVVGGQVTVTGTPGGGTTVTARVPIPSNDHGHAHETHPAGR